jgi:hypothetical protein
MYRYRAADAMAFRPHRSASPISPSTAFNWAKPLSPASTIRWSSWTAEAMSMARWKSARAAAGHRARRLDGQAGLADSSRPDERDQRLRADQSCQLPHIDIPAHENSTPHHQIGWRPRGRPQGLGVALPVEQHEDAFRPHAGQQMQDERHGTRHHSRGGGRYSQPVLWCRHRHTW